MVVGGDGGDDGGGGKVGGGLAMGTGVVLSECAVYGHEERWTRYGLKISGMNTKNVLTKSIQYAANKRKDNKMQLQLFLHIKAGYMNS